MGPSLTQNDLPGPLKNFLSIPIEVRDIEDRLNNAMNQLAKSLNLQQEVTRRRNYTLKEFSEALRAWQSKRPAPDQSQQEKIADLKVQIEECKRLHSEQLQEIKAASQKDQEELERNYQTQQQELEQTLQSAIEQLEQQLEQAKLQNETDQKEIKRLQELVGQSQKALENKKQELSQAQYLTVDLGAGTILEMVAIPGGNFLMGTEDEEIARMCEKHTAEYFKAEKPQHEVTVQAFYMGIYPVTQAQYKKIMGNNPSNFQGDDRPVEKVSWDYAVEFCKKLSKQTGSEYRLPTEAEWEYACRAGTTTAYYFGEDITENLVNYYPTVGETSVVGKYPSNDFGLYDMHGNVWEWCQDDWHNNYENAPNDGKAWALGRSSIKVMRGGSWGYNPRDCRSAVRGSLTRDGRDNVIGFRVVCVAPRAT